MTTDEQKELAQLRAEKLASIKHLNRLATWAQQDPTGPWEKLDIQAWVLNEIQGALGQSVTETKWQPTAPASGEPGDGEFVERPEPKNPTLWRYFQNAHEKQITHHTLAIHRMPDGGFHFYIHPATISGETEDYLVWPDPFTWHDMIVNKKDSPPPDLEKFKKFLTAQRATGGTEQ